MTDEQIAKLYDKALVIESNGDYVAGELNLVKFAELVAQHEREACAKICETLELPEWPDKVRQPLAQAIRARGEQA